VSIQDLNTVDPVVRLKLVYDVDPLTTFPLTVVTSVEIGLG